MASDDTMTFQFHSSLRDEDFENNIEDGYHHDPHNLKMCGVDDDNDDVDEGMTMNMSGLSIEGHDDDDDDDGDADAEFSDGKELSSDSDENDLSSRSCYPLPATPPHGKNRVKDYANDNKAQRGVGVLMEHKTKENDPWRKRCRRRMWEKNRSKSKKKDEEQGIKGLSGHCMDLEVPSCLSFSLSNSTLDTTSPIANWCISSPGDDPRDVKARLKMWAQAVAASASKYGT